MYFFLHNELSGSVVLSHMCRCHPDLFLSGAALQATAAGVQGAVVPSGRGAGIREAGDGQDAYPFGGRG